MAWSQLDLALVELIANLTDVAPGQAVIFLKGKMIGAKVQVARDLIKFESPGDEWRSKAERVLHTLTNELNPQRNRVIHDIHRFDVDQISRQRVESIASDVDPRSTPVTLEELEQIWHGTIRVVDELRELNRETIPWLIDRRRAHHHD